MMQSGLIRKLTPLFVFYRTQWTA